MEIRPTRGNSLKNAPCWYLLGGVEIQHLKNLYIKKIKIELDFLGDGTRPDQTPDTSPDQTRPQRPDTSPDQTKHQTKHQTPDTSPDQTHNDSHMTKNNHPPKLNK